VAGHHSDFLCGVRDAAIGRTRVGCAGLGSLIYWDLITSAAPPTSLLVGLVVAGMNDVLNSQGYTQAAWWNRIPTAAWIMMVAIALCCDLLFGYSVQDAEGGRVLFLMLPLVIAIAFFLIAEIDSPNTGVIQVAAENLISLARPLRAP